MMTQGEEKAYCCILRHKKNNPWLHTLRTGTDMPTIYKII